MKINKTYETEGPLGVPMKEGSAKALDEIIKNSDKDCQEIGLQRISIRSTPKSVDKSERSEVSWITTDAVDNHKSIVDPKGADWSILEKGGFPVTWNHNYEELPVGRALWVKRSVADGKNGWIGKTQYHTKPDGWQGDWMADAVWHLVSDGSITGKSIGFYPTKIRQPTSDEIKSNNNLNYVIEKWTAIEWAVTYTPSNKEAILRSVDTLELPNLLLRDMGLLCQSEEDVNLVLRREEQLESVKPLNSFIKLSRQKMLKKLNSAKIFAEPKKILRKEDIERLAYERFIQKYNPDINRLMQENIDKLKGKV